MVKALGNCCNLWKLVKSTLSYELFRFEISDQFWYQENLNGIKSFTLNSFNGHFYKSPPQLKPTYHLDWSIGVLCSSSSLIIFLVVRNLVGLFTGSRLDSPLTVWWWVCFWVLKSLERCWWGGGNYFSLKPGSKRVHYMEWGVFSLHYCSFVKHVKCDSNIICYIMMISIYFVIL